MKVSRRMLIPAVGIIAVLIFAAGAGAGTDSNRKARTGRAGVSFVGEPKPLPVRADDLTVATVWRNGEYHKVTVHLKRMTQATSDGGITEIVEPRDEAEIDRQLSPPDPALAGAVPTDAQKAAAGLVGADPAAIAPVSAGPNR